MLQPELNALAAALLQAVPVFSEGFADVWTDETNGYVVGQTATGYTPVFPTDSYSNYFYLRHGRKARTGQGTLVYDEVPPLSLFADVNLVAVTQDLKTDVLLQHLIAFLQRRQHIITGLSWNREEIILSELADADEDDALATLQRADGYDLVRVSFTLVKDYHPQNCLPDLC